MEFDNRRIRNGLAPLAGILALILADASSAGRIPDDADLLSAVAVSVDELASSWRARGPRDPGTLRAMLRTVELNRLAGRRDQAAVLVERCRQVADAELDPTDPLRIELCFQELRLSKSHGAEEKFARAQASYDEAQQVLAAHPNAFPELQADVWQAWANHLRSVGQLDEALAFYQKALRLRLESSLPNVALANNLTWLAWVQFLLENLEESEAGFLEATTVLDQLGLTTHPLRCTIEANLARFRELEHDSAAAGEHLENAIEHCNKARRGLPVGTSRSGFAVHEHRARLALWQHKNGHSLQSWNLLKHGLGATSTGHLELSARSADLLSVPVSLDPTQSGPLRREEIDGLVREVQRLMQQRQVVDEDTASDEWPLSRVQRYLDPSTAMLSWVETPGSSPGSEFPNVHAVVLRDNGDPRWIALSGDVPTPQAETAWAALQRIRRRMQVASTWPYGVAVDDELELDARAVGSMFWQPLEDALEGVDRVVLLPPSGRVLAELLQSSDGTWFGERYRISYSPSPVAHAQWRETATRANGGRALLVSQANGSDSLAELPGAAEEVRALASLFPSVRRFGGSTATLEALQALASNDSLGGFDVLHFATHAQVESRIPERSWLALSNGKLRADTILSTWSLDASLVTLSACHTVRSPSTGSDYTGFAQFFLGAGARSLLMSRWRVADRPTRVLMERFYLNWLERGLDRAAALQEAQAWLRRWQDEEGRTIWAHPAYWAGFLLYGDPG